mmetsp:Transcript_43659/g.105299  ORF Transcript_43659/g.105299 Transcript_43659/m.105299 type:complete len:421 (+) Transcript_43659:195-1457(+)
MKRSSIIPRSLLITVVILMMYVHSSIIFELGKEERFLTDKDDIIAAKYSTIWPFRKATSEWCYQERIRHRSNQDFKYPGLLFVKVPKTASSTLAGINSRIAHKVGERILPKTSRSIFGGLRSMFLNLGSTEEQEQQQVCSHARTHGRDMLLQRKSMRSRKPLLWSFVRDPAARVQSAFNHFEVSRKGVRPTLGHLISYTTEESSSNFQYKYLSTDTNPQFFLERNGDANASCDKIIQDQILKKYDFVGVVERWAESLAVMILLWNLQYSDVIVLPSKVAGGFDDGRFETAGNCKRIAQAGSSSVTKSAEDEEYLESFWNTTFRAANEYDYRLYQMANEKLTKTIHALGHKRVQEVVKKVKELEALSKEECASSAIFPCSSNGMWQYAESMKNCYWLDSGCGYPCIDRLVDSMKPVKDSND